MATLATATCIGAGSKLITTSEAYDWGGLEGLVQRLWRLGKTPVQQNQFC